MPLVFVNLAGLGHRAGLGWMVLLHHHRPDCHSPGAKDSTFLAGGDNNRLSSLCGHFFCKESFL